jgi:hypothetical protein
MGNCYGKISLVQGVSKRTKYSVFSKMFPKDICKRRTFAGIFMNNMKRFFNEF